MVFAAASLSNAFTEIADEYETISASEVLLNFAASSTLVAQIEQGASVDVFASADSAQMQRLIAANFVDESAVQLFASNELVLITPADNPAQIQSPQDLAQAGVLLVLAAPTVPIREYSNLVLEQWTMTYGEDYQAAVLANVVSEESNVRQVLTRIVLGEADAAFVYRSDITPEIVDAVQIIPLAPARSPLVTYPIAPLVASSQPDEAQAFIDFVLSERGQAILQAWGFCAVEKENPLASEATPEAEATPELSHEESLCLD